MLKLEQKLAQGRNCKPTKKEKDKKKSLKKNKNKEEGKKDRQIDSTCATSKDVQHVCLAEDAAPPRRLRIVSAWHTWGTRHQKSTTDVHTALLRGSTLCTPESPADGRDDSQHIQWTLETGPYPTLDLI